jgi:hypothetical protein
MPQLETVGLECFSCRVQIKCGLDDIQDLLDRRSSLDLHWIILLSEPQDDALL